MKRLLVVAGLLLGLWSPAAWADTTTTFTTIDSATRTYTLLTLTGILAGESEPSTHTFQFSTTSSTSPEASVAVLNSCHQQALLMMNRPGRFTFALTVPVVTVGGCTLQRNP